MKIRKIEFVNHPVLGDIKFDFTDMDGIVFNTIILAGDNGTGKSLLLNQIFSFPKLNSDRQIRDEQRIIEIELSNSEIEIIKNNNDLKSHFNDPIIDNVFFIRFDSSKEINRGRISISAITKVGNMSMPTNLFDHDSTRQILTIIFSDVEINFTPAQISTVTSQIIDTKNYRSERSSAQLATEITQLLIDIQSIDALEFAQWGRENIGIAVDDNKIDQRIKRFTNAFHFMFPLKRYDRIETVEGRKEIIFKENGKEMTISNLSSGEKQVVFRGSFLLKNQKSAKGALILIDEPEISLHPNWQLKILTYFKKLFSDSEGLTSQLIVATHSPFIIHNANRSMDKVIVLQKNEKGNISIAADPEFYSWTPEMKIQEAFNVIHILRPNSSTVFVEGKTDEKYFNKALEIFQFDQTLIGFQWIGMINENGNPVNTGVPALNMARTFFLANLNIILGKAILLYDSDAKKSDENHSNLFIRSMVKNSANSVYNIGIENLLKLPTKFKKREFYIKRKKVDGYNAVTRWQELDKTKLCGYICEELDPENQKLILANLKIEIEKLLAL